MDREQAAVRLTGRGSRTGAGAIPRRSLFALGGASVAGLALTGCTTENQSPEPGNPTGTAAPSGSAGTEVVPSYQATEAPTADLPGSVDLMPAFLTYPDDPPQTVADPPVASGTAVSIFGTQGAPQIPMADNTLWQAVAEDMGGAELEFIITPNGAEQRQKLNTMLAGDDLTDIVQLAEIAGLPDALEARFADLTDHLGGDAILDYPNLAALPTWAWEGCIYSGRLYTVPVARGKLKGIPIIRTDIVSDLGLDTELADGEAFRQFCRDLTDEAAGRWALGQNPAAWVNEVAIMMGAPNQWGVADDGSFTFMQETDEFRAALEQVRAMFVDDKVFHPDSPSGPNPQPLFAAGAIAMEWGSYAVWPFLVRTYPESAPGSLVLPKWEGGGPAAHPVANEPFQFSGLKKADPDRIAELLRVLNYFAAPCGSKEFTLRTFGIEGEHHTQVDGNRVLTEKGQTEAPSPVSTVVSSPPYLYLPGEPDAAQSLYDLQTEVIPRGLEDPTVGLFSEAAISDGPSINRELNDVIMGVVTDRNDLAEWDAALDRWRNMGGDKMRAEYEASNAAR